MGVIQSFISFRVYQTFNFGVKWVNYVLDYEMSGKLPF
jgi:hypothetical protein